jgi:hypothetical protein
MKYKYLLLSVVLLFCLNSCKKDAKAPNPGVTIVGKWLLTKHNSVLSSSGVQLSASTDTTFTAVDFVEYYSDGTGYFSTTSLTGSPSLAEFTYSLTGTSLTQNNSSKLKSMPETITSLTARKLSVNAISSIVDTDTGLLYTEIDDYYYTR